MKFGNSELPKNKTDSLISKTRIFHFDPMKNFVMSSKKIQNVGEIISIYENNQVEIKTLQNLARGFLLQDRILYLTKWKNPKFELININILNSNFSETFNKSLESLKPFNITMGSKNALFTSMLLEQFFI